jgi:polyhydroxybutyrate depolymerase
MKTLAFFSKICLVVLCAFRFSFCQEPSGLEGSGATSMRRHKLDLKKLGKKRSYLVCLPGGREPSAPLPALIVLHGAFSTARGIMKVSGFNRLAEREKVVVAYPEGAYGLFGLFQHWNAGHCCGRAQKDGNDDVGFLLRVIEDLQARYRIDGQRIYMVGFSNGGMMTYRFCAEHPRRIAAAAVLAGSIGGRASPAAPYWRVPQPGRPLPLIVLHGRQDDAVPYAGGRDERHGGEREYDSVDSSVAFWVKNNRCGPEPSVDFLAQRRIEKKTWSDEKGRPQVVLYSIDNWGHFWPGADYGGKHLLPGFNATEVIWEFFKGISESR